MIVRQHLDIKVILRVAWKRVGSLLLVSSGVYYAYTHLGHEHIAISTVPASILGVAIAFLIGFRVNSAYERWWEARKIWGALVNDSRSFSRQVLTLINRRWNPALNEPEVSALHKKLIYRQLAFVHALKNHLRKKEILPEITAFLEEEDIEKLKQEQNIPNAILLMQARTLQNALEKGHTEDFRHMQLDNTLNRFCDSMGAAERIKNTVFPRQYSYYSTQFTRIYSLILPFILIEEAGWLVIPFTLIIGFIFFALDGIASGIEKPFENSYNDIPMSSICRTLEINLRQMLGETNLPAALEPENGFLL